MRLVDTWLAIACRREARDYADRPIPDEVVRTILDAGRLAGSARNRQPWRFLVVESEAARERLAEAVYAPANVRGAKLVVAILGRSGLDTGRARRTCCSPPGTQGVGSCPNGLADPERARAALGLGADDEIAIVLTFGYPARERDPARRTPEEWSARANRKPLDELVEGRPEGLPPRRLSAGQSPRGQSLRGRACRSARRPSSGRARPRPRRAGGRCRSPAASRRRRPSAAVATKSRCEPIVVPRIDCQFR